MPSENGFFKMFPLQRAKVADGENERPNRKWFLFPKSRPFGARDSFGMFNAKLPNSGPLNETPTSNYGTFARAPRAMPMRMIKDQNGNHTF